MRGIALLVVLLSWWQFAAAEKSKITFVEPPLELNVALVLPDELMAGEGYKIDPVAFNDGYSNTYTLMTGVGEVQAISDYQLRRQIQEIQALQALEAMSLEPAYSGTR